MHILSMCTFTIILDIVHLINLGVHDPSEYLHNPSSGHDLGLVNFWSKY